MCLIYVLVFLFWFIDSIDFINLVSNLNCKTKEFSYFPELYDFVIFLSFTSYVTKELELERKKNESRFLLLLKPRACLCISVIVCRLPEPGVYSDTIPTS